MILQKFTIRSTLNFMHRALPITVVRVYNGPASVMIISRSVPCQYGCTPENIKAASQFFPNSMPRDIPIRRYNIHMQHQAAKIKTGNSNCKFFTQLIQYLPYNFKQRTDGNEES